VEQHASESAVGLTGSQYTIKGTAWSAEGQRRPFGNQYFSETHANRFATAINFSNTHVSGRGRPACHASYFPWTCDETALIESIHAKKVL
jgi:hypothetical protein